MSVALLLRSGDACGTFGSGTAASVFGTFGSDTDAGGGVFGTFGSSTDNGKSVMSVALFLRGGV